MVLVRSRVLLLHQYGKGLLQRRAAVHERDVDGPNLNTHTLPPRAPCNRRRNSRTRFPGCGERSSKTRIVAQNRQAGKNRQQAYVHARGG